MGMRFKNKPRDVEAERAREVSHAFAMKAHAVARKWTKMSHQNKTEAKQNIDSLHATALTLQLQSLMSRLRYPTGVSQFDKQEIATEHAKVSQASTLASPCFVGKGKVDCFDSCLSHIFFKNSVMVN